MALRNDLIRILRCPEDHSPLETADDALVAQINAAIRAGKLRNRSGQTLDTVIDGGFVRAAGDVLYPIVDEIPTLLRDESILLEQLTDER